MKLLIEALTKFACGLLLVGFLIFLPAGTFGYTYGWLLIGLLFGPMLIAVRLKDEEDLLTRELPGYEAYKKKVKYRLIPFIW